MVQKLSDGFNQLVGKQHQDHRIPATWVVCLTGALGLAVALGIGRFAFTPLLPLMRREGLIDDGGGAWLAAANYAGYLLGALSIAYVPGRPRTQVLGALLATAILTAGPAVAPSFAGWMVLRLGAGVVSAWSLVGISGWALSILAQRNRSDAAGWVFSGVGIGIAAAGGWVWWRSEAGALALWGQLGALALGLAILVGLLWPSSGSSAEFQRDLANPAGPSRLGSSRSASLVICYGALGFGYILPATYLPAMAQGLIDDPSRFGLVWPLFGIAAACSTLLAGRAQRRWRAGRILAGSYAAIGAGCAIPLFSHSGLGLALAALLVGGTFMIATMTGLQEARSLAPVDPRPLLARMTAAFALGQITGPLVALALDRIPTNSTRLTGVSMAHAIAAGILFASALWLYQSINNKHPHERTRESRAN